MGEKLRGFTAELLKVCPSLPYMALGVWLAWSFILCSGTAWLSDTEIDGRNITTLFITANSAMGIGCLLVSRFPQTAQRLLARRGAVLAGACVSAGGCLLVIVIGPYYLYSILPYDMIRLGFVFGSALGGLGSVPIVLRCIEMYGGLPPRRVILYTALSHIVAALVYFVVLGAPSWAPVSGGPSLAGILAFTCLPLVCGILASLPLLQDCEVPKRSTGENGGAGKSSKVRLPGDLGSCFTVPFVKLACVVFAFSVVMFSVRAAVVVADPVATTLDGTRMVMLLRMVMVSVFALVAIGMHPKQFNFGKMYSLVMAVAVALVAILPVVGALRFALNSMVALVAYLFDFVLWCIFAFVVYQKRLSPVAVCGFAYGGFLLGSGFGWALGAYGFRLFVDAGYETALYLGLAVAVLVFAFILFSEREFDQLFMPADEGEQSLDELLCDDGDSQTGSMEASMEEIVKKGRFTSAIDALSEQHGLSQREKDVFRCLAMGYDSSAIAKRLSVSKNTVRTHTRNVYAKLGVHSKQELIELVDAATKGEA